MNKMENKIGKAYAFFDCRASKKEIESKLPTIRECVKTPRKLELVLKLTEDFDISNMNDSRLEVIINGAKRAGINYAMEATYPNHSNEQTAEELSIILNQMYQTPLYKEGEKFRGEVIYKERGEYIFRE
jgi:hypothetical protein